MHFACEKKKEKEFKGDQKEDILLVELCLNKIYSVLPLDVYERDLVWKHSLCRCNLFQIWSFWVTVGPNSNDWCLYEWVRNFWYIDAQENHMWKIKGKIIVMYPQARVPGIVANRKLGEKHETISLEGTSFIDTFFWTSSLQD